MGGRRANPSGVPAVARPPGGGRRDSRLQRRDRVRFSRTSVMVRLRQISCLRSNDRPSHKGGLSVKREKNGGGGGSRTRVRTRVTAASTCVSRLYDFRPGGCRRTGHRVGQRPRISRSRGRSLTARSFPMSSPRSAYRMSAAGRQRVIYARPTGVLDTRLQLQPVRRSRSPPLRKNGYTIRPTPRDANQTCAPAGTRAHLMPTRRRSREPKAASRSLGIPCLVAPRLLPLGLPWRGRPFSARAVPARGA